MRIAIVGTGALGGYYGARMAQAGYDIHFLMRSDYAVVKERGMIIKSPQGDFELSRVNCYLNPEDIGKVDVVFIGLKTTANNNYLSLIRPLVEEKTMILTAQNGLGNEERLSQWFSSEQIAGGLAFICCNRTEPGVICHQDYGHIHIGNYNRVADERLKNFGSVLNHSRIDCQIVDNLALSRWKKLVWNIPFNGLSTALNVTVDKIVANPELKELAIILMKEVQEAARAWDLDIDDSFLELMMNNTRKMTPYYTSMHLDWLQGRPLEIEAIFGEPLRQAARQGIVMPATQQLYDKLRSLSRRDDLS